MTRLDGRAIKQQVERFKLNYPEVFSDDEDWLLSLSSETDLFEFLDRLIVGMQDAAAMAGALATAIADMEVRQSRFVGREKALRRLALDLMTAAGLPKVERPLATLSVRKGGMSVSIPDDTAVPDAFCKFARSPDRTAIKEHLQNSQDIPNWAALVRGADSVSVRFK